MTCIVQLFLHPAYQIPNKNCIISILLGLAKGVRMHAVCESDGKVLDASGNCSFEWSVSVFCCGQL